MHIDHVSWADSRNQFMTAIYRDLLDQQQKVQKLALLTPKSLIISLPPITNVLLYTHL